MAQNSALGPALTRPNSRKGLLVARPPTLGLGAQQPTVGPPKWPAAAVPLAPSWAESRPVWPPVHLWPSDFIQRPDADFGETKIGNASAHSEALGHFALSPSRFEPVAPPACRELRSPVPRPATLDLLFFSSLALSSSFFSLPQRWRSEQSSLGKEVVPVLPQAHSSACALAFERAHRR